MWQQAAGLVTLPTGLSGGEARCLPPERETGGANLTFPSVKSHQ